LLLRINVHHAIETPNIFAPVSTPAFAIRDLSFLVLAITAAIFVIVAGFAACTLIRLGRRPAHPGREPAQVYGSTQIELAWTVVPLLIVVVLFLVTARYLRGLERRAQPPDALEIPVVRNQWWWEIPYPKLGMIDHSGEIRRSGVIMWVPGSMPFLLPIIGLIFELSSGRVAIECQHA
jgi:cytochrome c oxidase subunit 2